MQVHGINILSFSIHTLQCNSSIMHLSLENLKSCLGQVLNSKLGCIGGYRMVTSYMQHLLELKCQLMKDHLKRTQLENSNMEIFNELSMSLVLIGSYQRVQYVAFTLQN